MVWYQINPDYFEKIVKLKNLSGSDSNLNFFQLVKENINYIKELNFSGIWLMPLYIRGEINKKGNGSPYAVKEFEIDFERWGRKEDLIDLIKTAHENNIHVITEYVPNHMSPDAPFIIQNEDVVYRDDKGDLLFDQNWTDTVKLKHKNPLVQEFTQNNMINIINTYGFDGFRIDMAHCPFYDIDGKPYQGEWDSLFWSKVFDNDFFETHAVILIGEVYDDRNKDFAGYGDQIKLIKNNMSVYDKKIHDIISHKLKSDRENIQESIYRELSFQVGAMAISDNYDYMNPPFLRIPSNHDDNPGISIYGGVKEYICGVFTQIFIHGESMIYSGDEFGLKVKPSLTGEDKYDEHGNLTESQDIHLVNDNDQELINKSIKKILEIKENNDFYSLPMLIAKIKNDDDTLSNSLLGILYFNEKKSEIFLCIANLSKGKQWGYINGFYPTLDNNLSQYSLFHLLEKCKIIDSYGVADLFTNINYGKREIKDPLWLELDSMELQVLELKAI